MGSSSEPNAKDIDPTVGGLVWVRRRNGSWWPGRIMSLDELPEDCLISLRSGTPVKLLGREDASVDWYNLERSKRVKAFRCGEYDECIEKAKAAANANKKAVKYARREDAILHALELESALESKNQPEFFLNSNHSPIEQDGGRSFEKEPSEDSEEVSRDSEETTSNSVMDLSQSGISFEDPPSNHPKVKSVQGRKKRKRNDSEDDGTEGIRRMRGLEEIQQEDVLVNNISYTANGTSIENLPNGIENNFPSLKRKRSQVSHVQEFLKKKDRRRPLAKVLESTAIMSVPIMCEEQVPPRLEFNESNWVVSVVINNVTESNGVPPKNGILLNGSEHAIDDSYMIGFDEIDSSYRLFDVPFVEEENFFAGLPPIYPPSSSKPIRLKSERLHAYNGDLSQITENGTSKWQSKGKRNSRHNPKNSADVDYEADMGPTNGFSYHDLKVDKRNGFHHWGKLGSSKATQRSHPYRQSRFCLCDVVIEVKAADRPQHVPLVSLMSKLNGKAFIGHPLTVEVMDNGTSDQLLNSIECFKNYDLAPPVKRATPFSPNKSSKNKKSGLLSKKTRKLSSLTSCQKLRDENQKPVFIEKVNGQAIACVPLKVVFSRLNEAVSGSSRNLHRGP